MVIIVAHVLVSLAFVMFVARKLADDSPIARLSRRCASTILGNLLLTFVMLWAYLSFSQFLIIWSGNMPEEISWYMSARPRKLGSAGDCADYFPFRDSVLFVAFAKHEAASRTFICRGAIDFSYASGFLLAHRSRVLSGRAASALD